MEREEGNGKEENNGMVGSGVKEIHRKEENEKGHKGNKIKGLQLLVQDFLGP